MELKRIKRYLFASEVGWYLTPFLGFPLNNRVTKIMCLKPIFCSGDDLEELFRLGRTLQFCLAFPLRHPKDSIVGIAVNGLVVQTLVPTKGKSMDNGQELPDIIRSMHRTIVEDTIARLQIYRLIFHRSWIPTTSRIHCPCVCSHIHWQRKYGVVSIIGRVLGHHL